MALMDLLCQWPWTGPLPCHSLLAAMELIAEHPPLDVLLGVKNTLSAPSDHFMAVFKALHHEMPGQWGWALKESLLIHRKSLNLVGTWDN